MNLKEVIRPITYLKTNAADVLATVTETRSPVIITHNGEAKMVVQDAESYSNMMESLNMLKLVAMGEKQIEDGETRSADEVFKSIEKKLGI
ncbi:MAG: type II toxin-antitoxin system Phd/YefM family antitoxin [bacterium]|nr:type II toxin-antitoxin system Phd/YefM family antitoxin [bacterium]